MLNGEFLCDREREERDWRETRDAGLVCGAEGETSEKGGECATPERGSLFVWSIWSIWSVLLAGSEPTRGTRQTRSTKRTRETGASPRRREGLCSSPFLEWRWQDRRNWLQGAGAS